MPHDTYGLLKAVRSHYIASPDVGVCLKVGRPNACNLCHLDRTLDWTAKHLTEWYGKPPVQLGEEESTVSPALLWLLRGDAAQRALVAWNMGWKPAREISGERWLVPFLAQILDDPYSAVRFIAYRSLRSIPGHDQLQYDYVGPPQDLASARNRMLETWVGAHTNKADRSGPQVLINANGELDQHKIDELLQRRDNRSVELIE